MGMSRKEASFILMLAKNRVCDDELNEALDMAIKALEQEPKWIPVSERLPEKRGNYLVTKKATFTDYVYISVVGYALNLYDVDEYDFADKKRSGWYDYDREWGYLELDDVIAWMPLPTPYKAESEDKKEGLKYCDRNICVSNEYSGIGCDECMVNAESEDKE